MVFKGVNHVKKIKWESIGSGASRRRLNMNRGSTDKTDKTCGSSVSPGVPLTRAEQETRRDSKLSLCGLDGQSDHKLPTAEEGFAWLAGKMRLDSPQLDVFLPEADPYLSEDLHRRQPGNLRAFIVLIISLLIVFGAIYFLVEYLLFATRASATSCTPSTVYIPVTRYASASTVTTPTDGNYTTSMVTIYSTSTSWLTTTSYATVSRDVIANGLTTSGGPSYYFTVDSAGSTDWLNGVSPAATASLTVITKSIFVTPVMPTISQSTATATITSTAVLYQTITVPAYISTSYSDAGPETTVTSTSTNYVTYTVSRVSSARGPGTTGPRPSYTGPGTYGWNSSSTDASDPTNIAAAAEADPQLTTMTEIHYWGDDDATTSTSTRLITTSMRIAYTTVLTPSVPELSDSPEFVTTVTALPVTITYSSGQFSTGITFNGTALSPAAASSSSSGRSSPYQTGVSSSTAVLSTGVLPSSAQITTSGVFTNSTGPATIPAAGYSPGVSPLSSLSSSSAAANASAAVPLTGSVSSPGLSATTTVSSGPGPILTSAEANSTIGITATTIPQAATSQASSSTRWSSISSASGIVSPALGNVTLASASTQTSWSSMLPSGTPSSSSEAALATSMVPPPAYGSYSALSVPTTSVATGPVSSSSASEWGSLLPGISPASISSSITSGSGTMSLWSTLVRSSTILTSTQTAITPSSASSLSTASNTTTSPAPTIALSSEPQPASSGPSSSVSIISYSQTYVPTTMSAIPATALPMPSTGCGEYGNFTLDFDNLPNYTPNNQNQTDITQAPPIENPYHHFAFSDGYVYAPDPKVPFEPISQPHLAVFLGNGTGMKASQSHAHTIEDGEFADGPYEASTSFWFDAFSAWLGCDNEGPEICTLVMSAYTYSTQDGEEVLSFQKNATIPGCPGFKDCKLQKVEFPKTFKGLSGLQIQAFVGEEERMFFMDDVAMRWTDNSCIAGLTRQRAR